MFKYLLFGRNKWRSIGGVGCYIDQGYQGGVVLNGKVHRFTYFLVYNGLPDRIIVSFDLADETFGNIPIGEIPIKNRIFSKCSLVVLGGCLAAAVALPQDDGGRLEIWVMKEYNVKGSWVKEFVIENYTPPSSINLRPYVKFVCSLKNGEFLLQYQGDSLVSYDPKTGVFSSVKFKGLPNSFETTVHLGCLNWIDIPPADL